MIDKALDVDTGTVFQHVEHEALAAASVGQVHAATLNSSEAERSGNQRFAKKPPFIKVVVKAAGGVLGARVRSSTRAEARLFLDDRSRSGAGREPPVGQAGGGPAIRRSFSSAQRAGDPSLPARSDEMAGDQKKGARCSK